MKMEIKIDIPIIDASKLKLNDSIVGYQIKHALENFGFFYISNYDYAPDTSNIKKHTKHLFDLPEPEKEKIKQNYARGWSGLGSEVTKNLKDWHECVDYMSENNLYQNENDFFSHPNQWINSELKEVIYKYTNNSLELAKLIMESIAKSYDLPLNKFTSDRVQPFWTLRQLYYPVLNECDTHINIGIGVGEHTDYGCLTFVLSDEPGLEIKYNDMWMPIIPLLDDNGNNLLICNIGDMFSYWTRGILKATPHRVVRVNQDRWSVAFFYEPNLDTIVKPLDELKNHPLSTINKDDEIHYGTYMAEKFKLSYPSLFVDEKLNL